MSECPKEWRGLSSADICRRNGWTVGTQIVGDQGYGPTTIEITAVGEKDLLAREIPEGYECSWTLHCRDWKVVRAAQPPKDVASTPDAKKIGEMALYYSNCAAGERQGWTRITVNTSRLLEVFRAAITDAIAQCESESRRIQAEALREAAQSFEQEVNKRDGLTEADCYVSTARLRKYADALEEKQWERDERAKRC